MNSLWEPWNKPYLLRTKADEILMAGELLFAGLVVLGLLFCFFYVKETIRDWRKKWRKRKSS
jgi:hypothetical protein